MIKFVIVVKDEPYITAKTLEFELNTLKEFLILQAYDVIEEYVEYNEDNNHD
jgi:hypothetical protein